MPGQRLPNTDKIASSSGSCTTRQMIMETIRADEGITKSELVRLHDLGWGTVGYHLDRLQQRGMVQILHHGRCTSVFPSPRTDGEMQRIVALRRPLVARVLELLRQRPEVTVPVVMEQTHTSRFRARACLQKMEELDLLVRSGHGNQRYHVPLHAWTNLRQAAARAQG